MTRVFVWGAGRCGRALAHGLHAAGHDVAGTWNRTAESAERGGPFPWPAFHGSEVPEACLEAEVVWFTVLDSQIQTAANAVLRPHHIALHAAGAVAARVLRIASDRPASVASCHPLQTFTDDLSPPHLVQQATFGIEGEAAAIETAKSLVDSFGASHFVVEDEQAKVLYHAACCVASNAMVALADRAVSLFSAAGVSRTDALRALSPLIMGTAENLSRANEASDALSGPIHRGDTDVVRAHLESIAKRCPSELTFYRDMANEILKLVPKSPARDALAE
jgi:predicted short-subunit dehydrogenase-like oxidoreductase (DUF2520 family)